MLGTQHSKLIQMEKNHQVQHKLTDCKIFEVKYANIK